MDTFEIMYGDRDFHDTEIQLLDESLEEAFNEDDDDED